MFVKTSLLAASLALLGLTVPSVAEPTLVGIWFSPFQPDEPNVMSLIEFKADGTFHEEFRKCDKGDFVGFQTEAGTWSVNNDVEHINANVINGDPATAQADYKIVSLTDTERRIRMDPQGYIFVGHRVTDFEFPECATGT
ncbi:MAG TPA: lipocalin family protein [Micropepsaceae bacterium]|nr:lipocalin family protein [Micropepsaceae bacterium]